MKNIQSFKLFEEKSDIVDILNDVDDILEEYNDGKYMYHLITDLVGPKSNQSELTFSFKSEIYYKRIDLSEVGHILSHLISYLKSRGYSISLSFLSTRFGYQRVEITSDNYFENIPQDYLDKISILRLTFLKEL